MYAIHALVYNHNNSITNRHLTNTHNDNTNNNDDNNNTDIYYYYYYYYYSYHCPIASRRQNKLGLNEDVETGAAGCGAGVCPEGVSSRKGTHGVSTKGGHCKCYVFDRVVFGVPLAYFCLPKSARAYLFPQPVKIHYFCSGPINVDPICKQPNSTRLGRSVSVAWTGEGGGASKATSYGLD